MLKPVFLIAGAVALISVAGCTRVQPVQNVEGRPMPSTNRQLTAAEIERAITLGGSRHGWVVAPVAPGRMRGTITERQHTAVVDIAYTQTSYSIRYNTSSNLSAGDGEIHRNYNRWIRNLERDIDKELLATSLVR